MDRLDSVSLPRRQFCKLAGASAGLGLFAPGRILAKEQGIVPTMMGTAATAKITIQPLRRNISLLEGSGGNIAVLTGRDGKLLVDAGFSASRPAIEAALKSITGDPIRHLINTHWHFDHTDGNGWLHSAGATVVAHENTRNRLSVAPRVDGWDWTFPPSRQGARPVTVFSTDYELRNNDSRIVLKYYTPAHTDTDISVFFTDAEVLHVGDTWWNGVYPFIDYSTGGSIDGSIRAAEANVKAATSKTIVIPGHGPVGGRSELVEYRDMLVTVREKIAALKQQGRSLHEIVAAKPTAAYDSKWGNFLIKPSVFTGLVYAGV
ncbi:MAG TPA: MBL fold metallo-hydrolase [Bryobacteraceae bacterium]|nr:MBL fold metallo-hydrolase [Bryobacteraceae bacterium]